MSGITGTGFRTIVMLVISLMACQFVQAQNVSLGIKGGFIADSDMKRVTGGDSESKSYIFGPTFEAQLPFEKISIETSLLYHRVGYRSSFKAFSSTYIDQVRGDLFEVFLLLKYYPFGTGSTIQPFISGGPAIRNLANATKKDIVIGIEPVTGQQMVSTYESNVISRSGPFGLSIGAGVLSKSGRVRFSPEIRYTKWSGILFDDAGSHGYTVESSTNKLEFMFNLSFVL